MSSTNNKNDRINEMMDRQIPNIPKPWKLHKKDIERIVDKTNGSIFDPVNCCLWQKKGQCDKKQKPNYINFFLNNKKIALHRILHSNFISVLTNEEYIKYTCPNNGICININHIEKKFYSGSYSRQSKASTSSEEFTVNTEKKILKL
jgi:hypothetical protein